MEKEINSQTDMVTSEVSTDNTSEKNTTPTEHSKEKKRISKKIIIAVSSVLAVTAIIVALVIGMGYKIVSIKASYKGDTVAGTVLDKYNSGIVVEARTRNGNIKTVEIGDWSITSPRILEADSTSRVIITYGDVSCDLKVTCTDSSAASITAYYDGKAEEGTVISNISDGFSVMATLKDNSKIDVTQKCTIVGGPVSLKANKSSTIDISYTDPFSGKTLFSSIVVSCTTRTVNKITAKYIGSASAGEILDENNSGIVVTALFNNGDVEEVSGWTVDVPATLEDSKIATVCIYYGDTQCKLTVECSSMDPNTYKRNCAYVYYSDLMRTPEKYENTMVRISGTVSHINSSANTESGYLYKIRVGSGQYVNVALNGETENVFLEDDYVSCYGEFRGIDRSGYEEIPIVSAKYVVSGY